MTDLEAPPPYSETSVAPEVRARVVSPNHVSVEFSNPTPTPGGYCTACTTIVAGCTIIALSVLVLSFIFTLFEEDNTKALVTLGVLLALNIVVGVVKFLQLEYKTPINILHVVFYVLVNLVCIGFVCYPHSTTAMYIFVLLQVNVTLQFK